MRIISTVTVVYVEVDHPSVGGIKQLYYVWSKSQSSDQSSLVLKVRYEYVCALSALQCKTGKELLY